MKIGSLCSGYGGLDMAVEQVYGGELAWVSDIDKGACKILAHRFPDVPNIGDMTTVDWDAVEPVDVITAGYPCQPFSHAGNRKGTNDVRHLWPVVREAVRVLRPRLTVLENVAGHRSLGFDRVLGDLAEGGMHVRWTSVRASDIGAPHQRERLFILVTPPDADRAGRGEHRWPVAVRTEHPAAEHAGSTALLPTPAVNDMGAGKTVEEWDAWTERMKVEHGNGNGHGASLSIEAQRLPEQDWGQYAAAIARWESQTRPAPPPTETGPKGNPRLSAAFSEWMMGLPAGWVTDVPSITRNEALKALGNGVVPQQAAEALRVMASWEVAA